MSAASIVRRNWLVYWRAWRSSFFLSVLTPLMFLSAMGLGLGSLVQEEGAFGGAGYLKFFATGIFAASCMQSGVFSATYPVMGKITWQRNYEAMLASPLSVRNIFFGELGWMAVTLAQISIPFFGIMALFDVFDSPTAILAVPIVILLGLSCAAPVFALTATLQTDEAYTWLFRFVVTPLFLLSGTFFPIEELPAWGRVLAQATPLYHGVELVRQFTIFDVGISALWHVAYLVGLLTAGILVGVRNLERRLLP
ncbi:MAG TPA: ABC transporter permease [Actinomycetota bacterium]|nr:ABC transporter permease [Actinomycetota bacterium]